jgi:hypothetical protein
MYSLANRTEEVMILSNLLLFIALIIPFLGLLWLMIWLAVHDKVAYLFSICGIIVGIMLCTLGWLMNY